MKLKIGLLGLLGLASTAHAALNELRCRSFDYYNLGGNRKVVEVLVTGKDGAYEAKIFHIFETLKQGQYIESSRSLEQSQADVLCNQAEPGIDAKVVACSSPAGYFGLSRVDTTVIKSPRSSKPGAIIKTVRYEGLMFGGGKVQEGLKDGLLFAPDECELK